RFGPPPALVLDVNPDGTEASSFGIRMIAGLDYSPKSIDVVVRNGDATLADSQLLLTYSCVALTVDDWCWMAGTEMLQVTLPDR
ncbi:MAG TPA: hypothetical protein VK509_10565, partial [Polyangiales bacterium]|nr:hypothetical protein [Polyangiales bacterium]